MASRYPNIIPAYPAYSDPVYLPDTPKPAHRTSTYFKPMHDLISPIEITKVKSNQLTIIRSKESDNISLTASNTLRFCLHCERRTIGKQFRTS